MGYGESILLSQLWYNTNMDKERRPIHWVGSSEKDLSSLPRPVKRRIGHALHLAQIGDKSENAKPLKGLGPGVFEEVADYDGDTFRAVYTVRLSSGVYVLHCFQKKSKHGIETPKKEINLIKQRLAEAIEQDKRAKEKRP